MKKHSGTSLWKRICASLLVGLFVFLLLPAGAFPTGEAEEAAAPESTEILETPAEAEASPSEPVSEPEAPAAESEEAAPEEDAAAEAEEPLEAAPLMAEAPALDGGAAETVEISVKDGSGGNIEPTAVYWDGSPLATGTGYTYDSIDSNVTIGNVSFDGGAQHTLKVTKTGYADCTLTITSATGNSVVLYELVTLSFSVVDNSAFPIEGATVKLASSLFNYTFTTDSNGNLPSGTKIADLGSTTYAVTITKSGYSSLSENNTASVLASVWSYWLTDLIDGSVSFGSKPSAPIPYGTTTGLDVYTAVNDNYDPSADNRAVKYSSSDTEVATVNASTGELTLVKPGTATITAYLAEDTTYAYAEDTYVLEVTKADQTLSFESGTPAATVTEMNYITGTAFTAPTLVKGVSASTGTVTYSTTADATVAEVNSSTGVVDIKTLEPCDVVITATIAADAYYNEATASYTIHVAEWTPADVSACYSIEGTQAVPTSGYYNSETLKVKAKTGYKVATAKNGTWETELNMLAAETAVATDFEFYIKEDATGKISGKQTIRSLKWDKTAPSGTITINSVSLFEKVLHIIDNSATPVDGSFTIAASDTLSDMASVQYKFVTGSSTPITDKATLDTWTEGWTTARTTGGTYTIPNKNEIVVLYVKLTDNAGNVAYLWTNGVVWDTVKPGEGSGSITVEKPQLAQGLTHYNADVVLNVSVTDEGGSGIQSITYSINGTPANTPLYKIKDEGTTATRVIGDYQSTWTGTITVPTATYNLDNISVVVTVTDNAGNTKDSNACEFSINATKPQVSLAFDNNTDYKTDSGSGRGYYAATRVATFTVTDRDSTFDATAATAMITGAITQVDAQGDPVSNGYSIGSWATNTSGVHTITVTFANDANYTINEEALVYTNKAGLSNTDDQSEAVVDTGASKTPYKFTVDKTEPTATIEIKENTNWLTKLLYIITNNTATEKFTLKDIADATADVESVQWYIDNTTSTPTDKTGAAQIGGWNTYNAADANTIPTNGFFVLYFKIVDNSGNTAYLWTNGVDFDKLSPEKAVIAPQTQANEHGYYNKDIVLDLNIEDTGASGIKSVDYKIVKDGNENTPTQEGNLFTFTKENPAQTDLITSLNSAAAQSPLKTITVDSALNNSDDVVVTVTVTDNAGNKTEETLALKINSTAPVVELSYGANDPEAYKTSYYDETRVATFTVTDRDTTFDATAAKSMITGAITQVDSQGAPVADGYSIGEWTTTTSGIHTITVTFANDANYTIDKTKLVYTNKAGLFNVGVTCASINPYAFTVDKTDPTATIEIKANTDWLTKLLYIITNNTATEKFTLKNIDDATAGVESVQWYIDKTKSNPTNEQGAAQIVGWTTYNAQALNEIPTNGFFVLYFKIVDNSGNTAYLWTNGVDFDKLSPEKAVIAPQTQANEHGYYNKDIVLDLNIEDTGASGIKSVDYKIVKDGNENTPTQEGNLFTFTKENPAQTDLVTSLSSATAQSPLKTITVDGALNNSDDVVVTVTVTDNAGNKTEETLALKINITDPVIELSYNNNDAYKTEGGRGYYDAGRVATFTVTDRSTTFDGVQMKQLIEDSISQTDVNGEDVTDGYTIGDWVDSGTDNSVHTITVTFANDANYTIDKTEIAYTNFASKNNNGTDTGDAANPYVFTVDKVNPTAEIEINKNTNWLAKLLYIITNKSVSDSFKLVNSVEETAGIESAEWYIDNGSSTPMEEAAVKGITGWTTYDEGAGNKIPQNKFFVLYFKLVDNAGNTTYLWTNGVDFDTLNPEKAVIAPQTQANEYGYYNTDIVLDLNIEDTGASGIKSIDYKIEKDGVQTQGDNLFTFTGEDPKESELVTTWEKTAAITVDSVLNNSDDVVVTVTVTDNAGNVTDTTRAFKISVPPPEIVLAYDNNEAYKTEDGRGYYDAARVATFTVTDRDTIFDAAQMKKLIEDSITQVDVNGEKVTDGYVIGDWTKDQTGYIHTITVTFANDANYTIDADSIVYTNKASVTSKAIDTGVSMNPYVFTVDKVKPAAEIEINSNTNWLTKILYIITNKDVTDSFKLVNSVEETAGIESIDWYIADNTSTPMDETGAAQISGWKTYDASAANNIPQDEFFVLYFRLVDNSGNTTYLWTNGVIYDSSDPVVDTVAPVVNISLGQPTNGFYTADVAIDVSAYDPDDSVTSAGLKNIRYEVTSLGSLTQSVDLFNFEVADPKEADLVASWAKDAAFIVDSAKNNSNEVVVTVYAEDNAGNISSATANIMIDVTDPEIAVSYDNNDGDATLGNGTYFDANRVATITVTERNFDPDNVVVKITDTDGTAPTLNGWTTYEGTSGNKDDTTHVATISYTSDGDYTFSISCLDEAGNANTDVSYGSSVATNEFTIDKTNPVIAVSYDNEEALNGNYYDAARTATITITEHNFETSRIKVTVTASDDGASIDAPSVGSWSTSGDSHVATISYPTDGLYTFDITYSDMAGNEAADYTEDSFYVDVTAPALTISGITDKSANGNKGNIGFTMTATDTNFDQFTPVLTAVYKQGDKYVTKTLDVGTFAEIKNGSVFTVENLETDGIYRITCSVVDKAGNEYSEVILEDAKGKTYTEERSGEDVLCEFSVNRDGSAFELDEATASLVEKFYVQSVTDDVVIFEVNTDELTEYTVTVNGEELSENTDYTVDIEGGGDQWYRYTYTIDKSFFKQDGEYQIVISSTDKTGAAAFSDMKSAAVSFVVDSKAPVVTVSGMETGGRYQTDSQKVTIYPMDDGGQLQSLYVYLVDEDGNVLDELVALTGEDLLTALEENNGAITFEIGEGLYQNVKIVCKDCAVDEDGEVNTYEEIFSNISVSTSGFMIFWANKALRWSVIGGTSAVVIAGVLLLLRKKIWLPVVKSGKK